MAEITELKGLEIKLLPIKLLENNNGQIEGVPKNPRFIKDWRYKLLLQSLTESPEMLSLKELWVYKVGDLYVVIAGNMRLRGSKEKGYKSLPCKILPPETSVEKLKEYAIKDNSGYGDWEMDSLANEWESPKIVEWGVELHGWENGEMPFEESETAQSKEDDFDTTPPAVAKTVLGDLYEIGLHKLLCADCTDVTAVDRLMGGERADLVFTDPPYGNGESGKYGRSQLGHRTIENDEDFSCVDSFFNLRLCDRYVFFLQWRTFDDAFQTLENNELKLKTIAVWDKKNAGLGSGMAEQWEAILIAGDIKYSKFGGNVFTVSREQKKREDSPHPHQKPIELLAQILDFLIEYNLLLDPFLGSGSTMVAAHQLKRKVYGMELEPKYVDVTIKRMLSLDSTLRVKRNGVDVTEEWRA